MSLFFSHCVTNFSYVFCTDTKHCLCSSADESPLDSTHDPMGFLGDIQSPTSSPLALPDLHYTAFESLDSPGALPSNPEPSHELRTADSIYRGHIAYENSKVIMLRDTSAEEPHTLTTPTLRPSVPVRESSPHFQGPAELPFGWKLARSSLSEAQTKSQLQPWENISITSVNPSATPQLGLNSGKRMTFQPEGPLGPPIQTFTDLLADESHMKPVYADQLSSSNTPLENKHAYDINMLPNPDEILSPGYKVPFITPQPTSPSSEPTELSPEDFYPTNTMEVDWGSGDYLETMSFFNADREDYSLVTKVPSDSYDLEDYTETYDTSFPSRVGISPSSLNPLYVSPSPSLVTAYSTVVSPRSIYPSSFSTTVQFSLEPTPTPNSDVPDISDVDWSDTYTIQPTDVLFTPNNSFSNDTTVIEDESSSDLSGLEPHDETSFVVTTEESPQLANASQPFLDPSIVPTHSLHSFSSSDGQVSTTDWSAHTNNVGLDSTSITGAVQPSTTPLLPDDLNFASSLTYVHWYVTESLPKSTVDATAVLTATIDFSPVPTEPAANSTAGTTELAPDESAFTNDQTLNATIVSTESTSQNVTLPPPFVMGDQGVTEDGVDTLATLTYIPTSSVVNKVSTTPTSTPATTTPHQATTRITATSEVSTIVNIISTTVGKITATAPTSRSYLCNVNKPAYLIKIGKLGILICFVLLQLCIVVDPPPKFVFRVVSGPVVYTGISVVNALRRSGRRFLSVSPNWSTPDKNYQVHSVLQFVPGHVDVRFCNFSESIERGLTRAFAEVRRRSKESTNFTVHIVNITMAAPIYEEQGLARKPVDITFTVRSSRSYLMGSEISNALMKLTMVEFSYYMGFPVLQIAERDILLLLCVYVVLLGVLDQKVGERTFQANMERRLALLLGEAIGSVRRVKRATTIGNSSVQVVSASRLAGADLPLEIVYFVEEPSGQRMPADQTASLLNSLDVQRAAIVLGYRVQGILAQLQINQTLPLTSSPSDNENTNMWIIIGVVIPLLVVIVIISILYWKLCRTDKLEFQPDAMTSIQQRQKLQAPTVKGFDFAKLHLGQQSKDDVMVIQEPVPSGLGPVQVSIKDGLSPSENGEIPTPISKTSASSTKASISSSDGDSVLSDHSSERESTEENLRAQATPSPPPMNDTNEQLSSASIFEHVDRISRGTDASRRLPNKVQLIAMQPMPVPPLHSPPVNGKLSDTNQMTKEIQVALRHKSEIEHHRNKIRLRAKRKGHYDFPAMDDIGGLGDAKDPDRIYHKEQMQIDKILDPDAQMPSVFMEPKKSGRGRRSPKQRMKDQMNGGMMEADKDHLITEDTDAAYRKCPGVNNVAYSDPDQAPASSPPGHAPPPPPYMPPQPSIEEARQQMHSLLDDAFALVSPTSQGSTAGITLPGVNSNPPNSSPPGHGPRPWGLSYQAFPTVSLFLHLLQGATLTPPLQLRPDSLYSSRGLYADELPSSARPRPVGGTTGAQLHHLAQVGLSSRMNGYPAGVRAAPGQNGGLGWNHYHDDNFSRAEAEKDIHRSGIREPTAPPTHLDGVGYLTAPPPLDTSPPTHSSASLIKAIREELLRLSQKQAAVPSYHS
uniref:Uncharacterized protein n=1 Tax=Oreochromis aureus TaxID=47969 RepID=A0A668V1Q2_OREAU